MGSIVPVGQSVRALSPQAVAKNPLHQVPIKYGKKFKCLIELIFFAFLYGKDQHHQVPIKQIKSTRGHSA